MKKPLIILTGPTAVGKTKASIGLAKAQMDSVFPKFLICFSYFYFLVSFVFETGSFKLTT